MNAPEYIYRTRRLAISAFLISNLVNCCFAGGGSGIAANGQSHVAPVVPATAVVLQTKDAHCLPPVNTRGKETPVYASQSLTVGQRIRVGQHGRAVIALANRRLKVLVGPCPIWTVPPVTPVGNADAQEVYSRELRQLAQEGGRSRSRATTPLISPMDGDVLRPLFFPIRWSGSAKAETGGEKIEISDTSGASIWQSPPIGYTRAGALTPNDASLAAALTNYRRGLPSESTSILTVQMAGARSGVRVTLLSLADDSELTTELAQIAPTPDKPLLRALLLERYDLIAEATAELDSLTVPVPLHIPAQTSKSKK